MLIYYLCFSNQHGEGSWRSSNAQQFTKRHFKAFFNSHFSFIKVDWLQGHVSILLAFHKIRIPHEKYCKSATKPSSANLPINIDTDASSTEILAAFQILLFLVTVKLPKVVTHQPPLRKIWTFTPPSVPQILGAHLTSTYK